MKTFYKLLLFTLLALGGITVSNTQAWAQCPEPNNNFPNFSMFDLTPTGVGDTVTSPYSWGGDYHHVQVDSGKSYWISMCETGYYIDSVYSIGAPGIYYDPQITLYNDTAPPANFGILSAGIVGHNNDFCGVMPQLVYTADFTGNLAIAIDPYRAIQGAFNFGCDSFVVDSAIVQVTEVLLGLSASITVNSQVSCNGGSDGGATASASGVVVGALTYSWSNGATTAAATGLTAGTYSVIVNDSAGNVDTAFTTITEPPALVTSSVIDSDVSCNGLFDGGATASASGGITPYTYTWSNTATTASIVGVGAATYSVTVTDQNGCTDSSSVTISEPVVLVASTVVDSNASCPTCGGATASATGGTAAYTYTWSNSATTASITGVGAATYSVTITDANGCTDSASVVIVAGPSLSASVVSNVSCNGLSDGSASASASGGTAGYTYNWSSGASSSTTTGLTAGTYTVTVTDAGSLTATASVTIAEPTILAANTSVNLPITCNGFSSGAVSASGAGGTPGYTYLWSNGVTTAANSGLAVGPYTVTVTDANGCTAVNTATLGEPTVVVAAISINNNVNCLGGSDGSATASGSGGIPGYTYQWSNGATTATTSSLAAGTYTVTATDANGCTDTETTTITAPSTAVIASISSSNNVSCNGFIDGGATASATGGTGIYTYTWSNSATTASIIGVGAGTYSVTITDANGCTDNTSITITEPTTLASTITSSNNISCGGGNDGSATANAGGGTPSYSFLWSNGTTTATATGLVAGTYTVTATDANGCTSTDNVTLTEPSAVIASAVIDNNVTCNGFSNGGATASATGGSGPYTYAWSNAATTASITGVVAGTYTVTVTDANGCTGSTTATVTEPVVLVASASASANVSCNSLNDGAAGANATGGTGTYTYAWSNAATTANISSLAAGTYSVTITDDNGCTDSASVTIAQPAALSIASNVITNVSCNGFINGGVTTTTTGGTTAYTYSWSNSATTSSITGVAAGTYSVTVTDANGCTDNTSITISEPPVFVATTAVDSNVSCNGLSDGGATASATGGTPAYVFNWSNSATTASISGLSAGTYTVTMTDANSCTSTSSVTITEPTALIASIMSQTNVLCNGAATGSITSMAVGGTAPYGYAWSNGDLTATTDNLIAGTYVVTVTDANGCSDSISTTITEPTVITITDSITNISCNGEMDGAINLTVSGGVATYGYLWSNGETTAAIDSLAAGIYTITVTDANLCTSTLTATITEPAVLTLAMGSNSVICQGGNDGAADATPSGGTPNYTYLWNDPANQTTMQAINLSEGTYSVVVTDSSGCMVTDSIAVGFVNTNPVFDFGMDTITGCQDTVIPLDGPDGFTYLWSTGETTQTIMVSASANISLEITDANGCSAIDSIEVLLQGPCVGINELFDNVVVRYYPNPTDGLVNLEILGLEGEDLEISVMNLFGQTILNSKVDNLGTQFNRQLDLSSESQGIYFVRLTSNGQSKVDRIVVQ